MAPNRDNRKKSPFGAHCHLAGGDSLHSTAPAHGCASRTAFNRGTKPGASELGFPACRPSIDSVTRTINDCENRTDDFRKSLRKALRNSPLDNSSREGQLNRQADQLEKSMDRVGDSWNRDKDISKTKRYVQEALNSARDINTSMRNWRFYNEVEREWGIVKVELNHLAEAFRLQKLRW